MVKTPIFNALRDERQFMCQACTDHGWPFAMFICAGDGLCDDDPWGLFNDAFSSQAGLASFRDVPCSS